MFLQDRFQQRLAGETVSPFLSLAFLPFVVFAEIIDVKAQYVFVINGVSDGVGVQFFFEYIFGGFERAYRAVDLFVAGVVVKNRCAGKAEQLRFGEEFFNGFVVFAKLRAMAFVENKHDALVAQRFQAFFISEFAFLFVGFGCACCFRPVPGRAFGWW